MCHWAIEGLHPILWPPLYPIPLVYHKLGVAHIVCQRTALTCFLTEFGWVLCYRERFPFKKHV